MIEGFLDALAGAGIGEWLNGWRWTYPIVNASHILGIGLLFGALLPLDLRLLGCWPGVPASMLARVLVPVAGSGLAIALVTGVLLFSVDPHYYAGLDLFQLKLALIGLAVVNLALLHRSAGWRVLRTGAATGAGAGWVRLAGLLSAGLWLAVIFCGRFVAYV